MAYTGRRRPLPFLRAWQDRERDGSKRDNIEVRIVQRSRELEWANHIVRRTKHGRRGVSGSASSAKVASASVSGIRPG